MPVAVLIPSTAVHFVGCNPTARVHNLPRCDAYSERNGVILHRLGFCNVEQLCFLMYIPSF